VDAAEPLTEHMHRAPRRVQPADGEVQQRRLAGAVRTEDHPALVELDLPGDLADQIAATAGDGGPRDGDDGVGIHPAIQSRHDPRRVWTGVARHTESGPHRCSWGPDPIS